MNTYMKYNVKGSGYIRGIQLECADVHIRTQMMMCSLMYTHIPGPTDPKQRLELILCVTSR